MLMYIYIHMICSYLRAAFLSEAPLRLDGNAVGNAASDVSTLGFFGCGCRLGTGVSDVYADNII